MASLTQQGIAALKAGQKSQAQQLLRLATQNDPRDLQAWLWLSGAVDTDQEKFDCLQQVLKIDPENVSAAKGIARLVSAGKIQVQPSTPASIAVADQAAAQPQVQPQRQVEREERTIFTAKPSMVPFMLAFGISLILLILVLAVFNWLFDDPFVRTILSVAMFLTLGLRLLFEVGRSLLRALFARYTLTTRHLVVETGILSRNHKTIPIRRIQDVTYHQHFLLRPFGVGDVWVESAGEHGQVKLFALAKCQERSRQILQIVQRYRS